MKHDKFDLEKELRAGRSEPRADFASALAGEVRGAMGRARRGRMGLMLALAGLIVVAVASFGGVGYASSQKPVKAKSAATAQYGDFTNKASTHNEQVAAQAKAVKAAPKVKSGQLPFTGLALWIPLAGGGVLIALGLTLRIRGRRGDTLAH
jgi:hypothetical protein